MNSDPAQEFRYIVDSVYGIYLDANRGFHLLRQETLRNQIETVQQIEGMSVAKLDTIGFTYGVGDPNSPDSYALHSCTQAEYKKRNEKNGHNCKVIGRLCIVDIYSFWEDHYREKVAESRGLSKGDLLSDIMGDIRLIRNSIVHHRWIALPEISKCKLLTWFSEGDSIEFTEKQFEEVIAQVYAYIDGLDPI